MYVVSEARGYAWSGTAWLASVIPATEDKQLAALVTTADGNAAIASGITARPALGGYVGARVNGVAVSVGNGSKTGVDCYFSGDSGTTARAFTALAQGDVLYWQGSVAGYQLATTDRISLDYEKES